MFLRLENQRAQGKPGARCTRSRVRSGRKHTRQSPQVHRNTRPSLRNGFNGLFRALPGDRACLPPSSPRSLLLENLTPASGRQDHTTSPSARNVIRLLTCRVHRIPCPTSVTIAKRPSVWAGMGSDVEVICVKGKSKYFCKGGWTHPPIGELGDLPAGLRSRLRQLLDLAEAVNYQGHLLPRPDRLVGHYFSGCHFADL